MQIKGRAESAAFVFSGVARVFPSEKFAHLCMVQRTKRISNARCVRDPAGALRPSSHRGCASIRRRESRAYAGLIAETLLFAGSRDTAVFSFSASRSARSNVGAMLHVGLGKKSAQSC